MNDKYFWAGITCILIALTVGMCCMSCNSNKPKVIDEKPVEINVPEGEAPETIDLNNSTNTKNETVQISNSVWPWAIVFIIVFIFNNAMWLAYLYMSKSYVRFGRK